MKKVAAIVVTYNRKELLRECLQALLAQTIPDLDILLIDNASTDGTKEYITDIVEENPSISYMNTGSNLGGAGGIHYGLKKAYEMGYDYMWIMDDDTIPYPDALEQLFIADKKLKGRYGFLSSCVLWTDGSYCNMNKPTLDQKCSVDEYEMLGQGVIRACRATFVSLLFKRKTIERVGLPLKQYFIWGDDQEYTLRISRRIPSYFVTDSRVVHKTGMSLRSGMTDALHIEMELCTLSVILNWLPTCIRKSCVRREMATNASVCGCLRRDL